MHHVTRHARSTHGDWTLDTLSAPSFRDEDRFEVNALDSVLRIALADGAGGMTGGRVAAEFAVREAMRFAPSLETATLIDHALIDRGQTTLVWLELNLRTACVRGVSVGDSHAWAKCGGRWFELTEAQSRKPLLGDGNARVTRVEAKDVAALCIASDGLAARRDLAWIVASIESSERDLAQTLIDPLRLSKGHLEDDVSIVLVRRREDG